MRHFEARLSPFLRAYTAILIAVVAVATALSLLQGWSLLSLLLALLLCGVILTGLFSVRGYALDGRRLLIQRMGWSTGIELSDLAGATPAPGIINRSLSLWGTRGLFGVVGLAYQKGLGVYRAYVTDPSKTVLLRFRTGKPVVISPDSPDDFVATVVAESGKSAS